MELIQTSGSRNMGEVRYCKERTIFQTVEQNEMCVAALPFGLTVTTESALPPLPDSNPDLYHSPCREPRPTSSIRVIERLAMRSTVSCLLLLVFLPALALGQKPEDEIKERYTKYEYRIPMRDGVKLFTAVYVPKDQSQKFPILMKRTPYSSGPYGIDRYPDNLGPSSLFWKEGYIFVNQDV